MRKGTKLSTYLCIITSYGVLDSQAAECLSCEPPSIEEIPFCAEFVHYSACRTSGTWQDMVCLGIISFFLPMLIVASEGRICSKYLHK
jgi:hypothetical protein